MSRRGIYVEMAHHPQAVLDTMAEMEGRVARAKVQQQLLQYLPKGLTYVGVAGFVVMFILVWMDTPYNLGCLFGVFFVMAAAGSILTAVAGRWQSPLLGEHFDAGRHILHTLRDDTGRRGSVVGWLDLGGPQHKEKEVRRARSGGGKQKVYYRDPWFKVKFKLVDGNLLRLTLEDKVKTKAGSIVRHQSQFSAKLVVNPDVYRPGEVPSHAVRVPFATLTHEDGVFVVRDTRAARALSAQQVLQTLKAVYSHLEPMSAEPALPGSSPSHGVVR